MSANLQAVQAGRAAQVGEIPRGIGGAALAVVVEVALGACLLVLFLLAAAWDPIDRKIGARGRRIAERTKRISHGSVEGAYAILPAD